MNINTNYLPTKRSALWLVASAAFTSSVFAQQNPMQIDVTGARESTTSILTPTKILQGNELQDKLSSTLAIFQPILRLKISAFILNSKN